MKKNCSADGKWSKNGIFTPLYSLNQDLLFISFSLVGNQYYFSERERVVQGYLNKFSFGSSRLSPMAIFDFIKLAVRFPCCDRVIVHACDFHSLACALAAFLRRLPVTYINHDAVPHIGTNFIRRWAVLAITYSLSTLATEIKFFSAHNQNIFTRKFPRFQKKYGGLLDLPSPASYSPVGRIEITRKPFALIFGRDQPYKIDMHALIRLRKCLLDMKLELFVAGDMSENNAFDFLPDSHRLGYLELDDLILWVDRSEYGALVYREITQSGVIAFFRARHKPLLLPSALQDHVELKCGDVVI